MFLAVARALAACIGAFSMLNSLVGFVRPAFDATIWWLDCRLIPNALSRILILFASMALLAFALNPEMSRWRRIATQAILIPVAALGIYNTVNFYKLLAAAEIRSQAPVAISLFVAIAIIGIFFSTLSPNDSLCAPLRWNVALPAAALILLGFPILQMLCFGKTDYRRPADVIVVLGARAYADGRASDALSERVFTAVRLYKEGLAPRLLFSGGPGDGAIHETESMRRLAMRNGVPDSAITLDRDGLNTRATARNTRSYLDRSGARRVLVVSHFYHLPRVKMAYQRENIEVCTVPADAQRTLQSLPWLMTREVAAVWLYYLRGALG